MNTPLERVREALERHGSRIVPRGSDGFQAQCPSHEDRNPSLSVRQGHKAVVLLCRAGCETEAVLSSVDLAMRDLYEDSEIRYDYQDSKGKVVRTVHRTPDKNFRQSRDTKSTPPLYGLPEVLEAVKSGVPIYFCEGEKDCEHLRMSGAVATTSPGGASNLKNADLTPLTGASVRIVPDLDEAGEKGAQDLAAKLLPIVGGLSFWKVSDKCKDFTDHYATGKGLEELEEFTPAWLDELREGLLPKRRLETRCLADVKPVRVSWLWEGRVPKGEVTLLGGMPGEGKSTLSAWLAAQITKGNLPGDLTGPAPVLWVSAEDEVSSVVVPRLIGAEADLFHVHEVRVRTVTDSYAQVVLPEDVEAMREVVKSTGAVLVVLDPVMSFLHSGVDTHKDHSLRQALDPLAAIAQETGASVLGLVHIGKGTTGKPLMDRILGSRGFTGVARSVLMAIQDPKAKEEGTRVLVNPKNNLGPSAPSLTFTLETASVPLESGPPAETSRVVILGEDPRTHYDLERELDEAALGNSEEHEEAVERLREYLLSKGGEAPYKEVKDTFAKDDYSEKALRRAAKRLGVEFIRSGFGGGSVWQLPKAKPEGDTRTQEELVIEETTPGCEFPRCEEVSSSVTTIGGKQWQLCEVHATDKRVCISSAHGGLVVV